MITLRASTVDSFRLYSEPDNDMISTEEMDDRLLGRSRSSAAADLGTAFHAAVAGEYVGAILFDGESIERARRGLRGATSEVFASLVLHVDGVPVRLTGHADWLLGLDMTEIKTSRKPIPPDRYADSMQWRCYAMLFGLRRCIYRHVQLDEDDQGVIYAKSIEDVVMYPYPQLRNDVLRCLRDLLSYATVRGLLSEMDVAEECTA